MTYVPAHSIDRVSAHVFVSYSDFLEFLSSCLLVQFFVKDSREAVLLKLNTLYSSKNPFSINRRFPFDSFFVDLSHPFLFSCLNYLCGCLSIPDRQISQTISPTSSPVNFLVDQRDRYFRYVSTLTSLYQKNLSRDWFANLGVFDAVTFENFNDLMWK